MHAKLTRDRKKMFTSRLQQLINALEHQNAILRSRLQSEFKPVSVPAVSDANGYSCKSLIQRQPIQQTNLKRKIEDSFSTYYATS